jgi:hypothetical protein
MTPDRLNEIEREAAALVASLEWYRHSRYRDVIFEGGLRVAEGARELIVEVRRVRAALDAMERVPGRIEPLEPWPRR